MRKQTPEPVFGIIKSVIGFRQFSLRGLEKVKGEWNLVTMAWNIKRMFASPTPDNAAAAGFLRKGSETLHALNSPRSKPQSTPQSDRLLGRASGLWIGDNSSVTKA